MDKEKLIALAKRVAELRQDVELAKTKRDSAEALMTETPEGKAFELCSHGLKVDGEFLSAAESQLKSAVLEVYEETDEKKPIDKVEVKISTSLEYDKAEALAWCKGHALDLLKLDKKPFEKTAVVLGAPVNEKKEPKCYLAQDLSIYLEAATESAA